MIYEFQLDCEAGHNTFELPEYFGIIANKDVKCYVSPCECFGSGWGKTEGGVNLHVYTNLTGTYNVMVVGTRMDQAAIDELSLMSMGWNMLKKHNK